MGWLARTLKIGGVLVLADTFIFDWATVLSAFGMVIVVLALVGLGIAASGGRSKPSPKQWALIRWACVVVLLSSMFGFAAASASQHNDGVQSKRVLREARRDLKLEHFRIGYMDPYSKTVDLLIGRSNCHLFGMTIARTTSRHDRTIRWRPVLNTSKHQVGLEAADLRTLAVTCSVP